MKRFTTAAIISILVSSSPVLAASQGAAQGLLADELWHSGGCRKNSPPGKCCHAGSKPYHCH